ncbi:MAG: hypothetical protein AAGE88_18190 [Actinomycetota bacterium]
MAVVESTIIAGGGGDYATISAWEADADLNGGADIWKGVISDNSAYDEIVRLGVASGTGTASSYVWLTVAAANRHAGVWDTGKARVAYDGTSTSAIEVSEDHTFVEHLQIYRPSGPAGSSDETMRVLANGSNGSLVSRCLFWSDDTANDMDGIYLGNYEVEKLSIDHCVFWGFTRSAIHAQEFTASGTINHTVNIDHCAMVGGGTAGDEATLIIDQRSAGTTTINVHNSWMGATGASGVVVRNDPGGSGGSGIFAGSHNAFDSTATSGAGTFSWTNNQDASDDVVEAAPGTAGIYITETTQDATFDPTPIDHANSVIIGNATNRIGSEPDARQDFSVDITGATRGSTDVDIGPFQISVGVTTPSGTGDIAVGVDIDGSGSRASQATGDASVGIAVTGAASRPSQAAGGVAAGVAVAGTGSRPSAATADTAVGVEIAGVGSAPPVGPSEGTGDVAVGIQVAGTGARASRAGGDVAVGVEVAGAGVRASQGAGAVGVGIEIAGVGDAPDGVPDGTGDIAIGVEVAGSGARPSQATADTAIGVEVAGVGQRPSAASAAAGVGVAIAGVGSAPGVGGAEGTGNVEIGVRVDGTASRPSTATGGTAVGIVIAGVGARPSAGVGNVAVGVAVRGEANPVPGVTLRARTRAQVQLISSISPEADLISRP